MPPIWVQHDHRQRKRRQRHKNYILRNKCWRSIFKIQRSYSTAFKLTRYFRRSSVYRKFVPRAIRTISIYTPILQLISYRALVNTPKLAYLLTSDSSIDTLKTSSVQHMSCMLMVYSMFLRQVQSSINHVNRSVTTNWPNSFKLDRITNPISQQLTLRFTSDESLDELIRQNNILLWKYSLNTPELLTHSYSLDYFFNHVLANTAFMMTYVLQTQGYLYNLTAARRYLLYSNLSLLQLEEFYRAVLTYKIIDSKILRDYSTRYIRPSGFFWYYTSLIQFLEHATGRKIALNFGPFLETALTFTDRAKCADWKRRILGFQRILGPKIFIYEALEVLVISIRLKDPTFLANWIRAMLARISFWKYRVIFRYLKFLLKNLIKSSFNYFNFKGAKFRLKGKISVAGNARTRMVFYRIGSTSHTTMAYRISYDLSYVHTFTGIQGFKIWFFY